jgi:hypothetical protein
LASVIEYLQIKSTSHSHLPAGRRVCISWQKHTFTMSHNVFLFFSFPFFRSHFIVLVLLFSRSPFFTFFFRFSTFFLRSHVFFTFSFFLLFFSSFFRHLFLLPFFLSSTGLFKKKKMKKTFVPFYSSSFSEGVVI